MFGLIVRLVRALFRSEPALIAENLALRQQLIFLKRSIARPKIKPLPESNLLHNDSRPEGVRPRDGHRLWRGFAS